MAADLDQQQVEGQIVVGHRIKVMGASGIKTDTVVHTGEWVEVTIRGQAGFFGFDPQKNGLIREIEVKASQQHCEVQVIEQPPEIEGQAKLDEQDADEDALE